MLSMLWAWVEVRTVLRGLLQRLCDFLSKNMDLLGFVIDVHIKHLSTYLYPSEVY